MNTSIFLFFYNLSFYPFFAQTALFLSYVLPYLIISYLLIWSVFASNRKMFNFSLLFLSCVLSYFSAGILKMMFQVTRPFVNLGITPLFQEASFSFPSEHATVFSAIFFACFFINKKLGIVMGIFAILIGISRMIIGVHYPFDILAGFVLGYLVNMFLLKFFKKIK